jgi:hypothetical protein
LFITIHQAPLNRATPTSSDSSIEGSACLDRCSRVGPFYCWRHDSIVVCRARIDLMPFLSILNAAIILAGGTPTDEEGSSQDFGSILNGTNQPAAKIFRELVLGARLGKLAASGDVSGHFPAWAEVDFDDAKQFIVSRGLLLSELQPKEGTRAKQFRLLQEKAKELNFNLHGLSRNEYKKLKAELQTKDVKGLFSNFTDIWKDAKALGIAKNIK